MRLLVVHFLRVAKWKPYMRRSYSHGGMGIPSISYFPQAWPGTRHVDVDVQVKRMCAQFLRVPLFAAV